MFSKKNKAVVESFNTTNEKHKQFRLFEARFASKAIVGVVVVVFVVAVVAAFVHRQNPTLGNSQEAATATCQFQKADQPLHVAFCDSFAQAMPTANNRSGDLNAQVWGVSRIIAGGGDRYDTGINPSQGPINNFAPVVMNRCGTNVTVAPDNDVQICNGQIIEAVNDDGGQTALAMYPKQPFDIAGRTGTVTFDVSDNSQGEHAAWPTFMYTDQPVPDPYSQASGILTSARNSFGFTMAQSCRQSLNQACATANGCPNNNDVSIDSMFVTRSYQLSELNFKLLNCIAASTSPTSLSHVEVRISQSEVQVWASDPGSTSLREIAEADNANLPLTRGLVWMEDNHYNGDKFNSQQTDTVGWDNLGFDGPVLPRDLAFDVPEQFNTGGSASGSTKAATRLGWATNGTTSPTTVTVPGVYNQSQASGALVTFNWYPVNDSVPSISVNGNSYIATSWPGGKSSEFGGDGTYSWRTMAVSVPLSEIQAGNNTIAFKNAPNGFANVDIVLQGAGGVPTCFDPSNCAGSTIGSGTTSGTGSGSTGTGTGTGTGSGSGSGSGMGTGTGTGSGSGSGSGSTGSGGEGKSGSGGGQPTPTKPPAGHTLGLTTIGKTPDNGDQNCLNGSQIKTGSSHTTLQSLSVYVSSISSSPNNQYALAVYSDNNGAPGTLVAKTATSTLVPTAWNTLKLSKQLSANTKYWLMYYTNGNNNMPYNNVSSGVGAFICPSNSGPFPISFQIIIDKTQYSIYATFA